MDAIKDIPQVERPLLTESGPAKLQKTDIFRKLMWFSYNNDNDWHSITCERVKEILELNAKNIKVFNLKVNQATDIEDLAAKSTRELELLDKKFATKKKKSKNKDRGERETQPNQSRSPLTNSATKPLQPLPISTAPDSPRPAGEFKKKKNKNRNKNKNNQQSGQISAQPQGNAPVNLPTNSPNSAREPRQNLQPREPRPAQPKPENKPTNQDQNPQAKSKFPPRRNTGPESPKNDNEKGS
jgi:hypothetical protein